MISKYLSSRILSTKVRDFVFSLIVCFYVLFDAVNGFFIGLGAHLPISVAVKFFLVLLSLSVMVKRRDKLFSLMLIVFVFVFPVIFRAILFSQDFLFLELNYLFKYLAFLLLIFYFHDYYSKAHDKYGCFYKLIYISYIVVVFNICLGFFGLGGYTYPNTNTGYKGFFVAGNELSAIFILFSMLIYGKLVHEGKRVISIVFILFSIFISISIGTKSSVLLMSLTMFIYPVYSRLISNNFLSLLKVLLPFIIVLPIFLYLVVKFSDSMQAISTIERVMNKVDNNHMVNAIFSGREIWFGMYVDYLSDNASEFFVYTSSIFGSGFYYATKATLGKHLIESDLVDLYSLSGMLGIFVVVSLTVYFAYVMFSSRKNIKFWKEGLYVHFALTLIAVFFGHVWTSGMLAVAYASMIGFSFSERVVKC